MHWADVEAVNLKERGGRHRVATGITPSGHIHVGNMREILTGDAIHRALKDNGVGSELIYIGDTYDPLRKVYPFLDDSYGQHVGKPLSEIPCPCGGHSSYAEHFLEPFLEALERLGIDQRTLYTHEMYAEGRYEEPIRKAINGMERVKEMLETLSGRELPEGWYPYNPKCSSCGRLSGTRPTAFEDPYVVYKCECGHEGKADIRKDDGKLPWRIEWPARWFHLGVTCEPFGKDHAAAGGSYETGSRIIKEVFGAEPPHPVVYEWIQLKGKGAMSSSKGVTVSAVEMLGMTPPEVLRFLMMKHNPNKHLDFDPGLGILNLVDEYDRYESMYYSKEAPEDGLASEKLEDWKRTYELSQPGRVRDSMPLQVPYRHFVSLVQITPGWDEVRGILERADHLSALGPDDEAHLMQRAGCVRYWLDSFAPENVKFSVQRSMPKVELPEAGRAFLKALAGAFEGIPWEAEDIHGAVHDTAKGVGIPQKEAFNVLYRIVIGKDRGPRIGYFFATLGREFILQRVKDASKV